MAPAKKSDTQPPSPNQIFTFRTPILSLVQYPLSLPFGKALLPSENNDGKRRQTRTEEGTGKGIDLRPRPNVGLGRDPDLENAIRATLAHQRQRDTQSTSLDGPVDITISAPLSVCHSSSSSPSSAPALSHALAGIYSLPLARFVLAPKRSKEP